MPATVMDGQLSMMVSTEILFRCLGCGTLFCRLDAPWPPSSPARWIQRSSACVRRCRAA